MLNDLIILNGEMTLEFNPLNTIYTINVSNDETILKFDYNIDENNNISIFGNNLINEENEIVITVYNDFEMMSYYLYVYKDLTEEVNINIDNKASLEVTNNSIPNYVIPCISGLCFLIILLFFTLLFKKNKN